jgi:polyphosphate glucokinase
MTAGNRSKAPATLAIDIGGTGLKASVLDAKGKMVADKVRVPTPYPCPPETMLHTLARLVEPLPPWDRISAGFPGVVHDGRILTAPHFGNGVWRDYPLAQALEQRLGKPVRLLNDAEIQGLAVVNGKGLEFVLVLGTGVGTALFRDGQLMPHLELAQHPIGKGRKTYNEYIGDAALHRKGAKKWNRRVLKTVRILESLLHYDVLHLSGGNGPKVDIELPVQVRREDNAAGIVGGIKLWEIEVPGVRR